jgi:hypothetical protein
MPYIKPENRPRLDEFLSEISDVVSNSEVTVGDLNYFITKLLLLTEPQSYADYNALVGMLECCKLEFYRRAIAAYEDVKIKENGDVYRLW